MLRIEQKNTLFAILERIEQENTHFAILEISTHVRKYSKLNENTLKTMSVRKTFNTTNYSEANPPAFLVSWSAYTYVVRI